MHYRYLIAITTCEKNEDRMRAVYDTWFKEVSPKDKAFFVYSDSKNSRFEGDNLYLDCEESYEKLPLKIKALYEYACKNFDFDYIYKCDDDTYLDCLQLESFEIENADYIGKFVGDSETSLDRTWHYGKCEDKAEEVPYKGEFKVPWAAGGSGYFLSKKACQSVISLSLIHI